MRNPPTEDAKALPNEPPVGARQARRACWTSILLLSTSCGSAATFGAVCLPTGASVDLPAELVESSGVAVSLDHPGVLWTHGDKRSVLYAISHRGQILARFPLALDRKLVDWEDVALSTCRGGGSCLYLADLGDNYEEHRGGRILRVREPDPAHPDSLSADAFPVRFPNGPRDTEAIVVLPGERVFVVTKGRNDPVTVYRYPGPLRPDTVTLQEVQRLTDGPRIFPYQLTGGAASPNGTLVALRTYTSLRFYRMEGDTLAGVRGAEVDLRPFREPQGEGVGIGLDGMVALTSEGGPGGGPGRLVLLRCEVSGL